MLITASLLMLIALTGCQSPVDPDEGGSLKVSFNDQVSRSLLPGISMDPTSYDLVGSGPDGATFSQTANAGTSPTIVDLAFGEWTVTATAKNSDGTPIGQGSGTATVVSNSSADLSITVTPYEGFGSLSLDVTWPAAQVQTAQIESTLTPSSGSSRDLLFSVNGAAGDASFNADDVATGYHTLVLKLLDNGHLAIGAVEVVRIVKGQTTSGSFTFTNVNQASGGLEIHITPEMDDPLEVSISGSLATKTVSQSIPLSAAVNNYSGNVTYVWYVNGTAIDTGASFAFDDSWAQGYYRIDVTAFSADGKRAGSATVNVQVMAAEGTENYTSPNIGTLVYVPAGSFQRDATPTNISVITKPYRMSKHEITMEQFVAITGIPNPSIAFTNIVNGPVQEVNWYHALVFCNKLSMSEGLAPAYTINSSSDPADWGAVPTSKNIAWDEVACNWSASGYRLPTEMEWMWAAMGATSDRANGYIGIGRNTTGYTKGYAGSSETGGAQESIGYYAWYNANSGATTHTVGTTAYPNELGLSDMSGNVGEWCWDWVDPTSWPAYTIAGTVTSDDAAGRGAVSGAVRAFRGGHWQHNAPACSVAARNITSPYITSGVIGFRVIRL